MAALAAFLLFAPPLYFLGPFVVVMLLSRPRRPLELLAVALAILAALASLSSRNDLGTALIKASAIAVALSFGLLSLRRRWSVTGRALAAVAVSLAALAGWCILRGIAWGRIESVFVASLVEGYRNLPRLSADPATQDRIRQAVAPLLESAPDLARVLPGLLCLVALGGMALATVWQHRIARTPVGEPPVPFREFRFHDQLIWGAIFSLALMLAPLPPDGRTLAANLLVIWAGLYAFRGLAIVTALLARAPALLRLAMIVLAIVVNPLAAGLTLAIGLADTWLDIRGRLLPSAPQGAG
jgi:hypothetical protein